MPPAKHEIVFFELKFAGCALSSIQILKKEVSKQILSAVL